MTQKETEFIVQNLLIDRFQVSADKFQWDIPLELLQEDFKLLGNLVDLEEYLDEQFATDISLLENFSAAFHTPKDIVSLLVSTL